MSRRKDGMAIPLLLLLLLALTALGHGTLLLARRELTSVWALRHATRAGRAVDIALELAFRGWDGSPGDRVAGAGILLLSGETDEGLGFEATLRWLNREYFLMEGIGKSRGWVGERRGGRVGWGLDPLGRLGAFDSAVQLGGEIRRSGSALLLAAGLVDSPEAWPADACEGYRAALDSLFPVGRRPRTSPLGSLFPEDAGPGAGIPPLGLLTGSLLMELASPGVLDPPPLTGSTTGCPDAGTPVLLAAEGGLSLGGGRICGIVAVGGDLVLRGDTRLQGLGLVGGDLIMENESALEGFVRVGGDVILADFARLQARACPVLWALDRLSQLRRPILVPGSAPVTGY